MISTYLKAEERQQVKSTGSSGEMDTSGTSTPALTACGISDKFPCPSESQGSHLPKGLLNRTCKVI